jgi:hypothetical protein
MVMTNTVEKLGREILGTVAHAGSVTVIALVALAALGVAAMSLWTMAIAVKALARRKPRGQGRL